jgi:hypothetical protein
MNRQDFDLWPYAAASLPARDETMPVTEPAKARRRWLPQGIGKIFAAVGSDAIVRRALNATRRTR